MRPILRVVLFLIFSSLCLAEQEFKRVCFKDACIQVEIADSDAQRSRGLSFRESLPEDRGMLFIFDYEARHSFWMRNMRFPLDIIWIDRDKKVADIKNGVQPCEEVGEPFRDGYIEKSCPSFLPRDQALYVLEVNSGFARKNNIKIGDKVSF